MERGERKEMETSLALKRDFKIKNEKTKKGVVGCGKVA